MHIMSMLGMAKEVKLSHSSRHSLDQPAEQRHPMETRVAKSHLQGCPRQPDTPLAPGPICRSPAQHPWASWHLQQQSRHSGALLMEQSGARLSSALLEQSI